MKEDVDPAMVLNPYTGKLMNVEPLFRFMRERDAYDGVGDIIKYLTQVECSEESMVLLEKFDSGAEIFYFMYMLQNMFKELAECEISLPNKRGGAK